MREIHEVDRLEDYLNREHELKDCVIQGLDLGGVRVDWGQVRVAGAIFLGCRFPSLAFQERLREGGALVFPRIPRLPYSPYRPELYSREELTDGWSSEVDHSLDRRIYDHFVKHGRSRPDVLEALAQRLHDHAIDDGLHDLLEGRTDGTGVRKKVVAVMGGHSTPRSDPFYRKVAMLTRDLTLRGYFVASGGGPGMMEAANLGAWFAAIPGEGGARKLEEALEWLSVAPVYTDTGYNEAADRVISELCPKGAPSVAIPTWFYGHEPSNRFSTYIAKYFSNSLREDGLLAIATYGVIYAPGSAGTTQEIFMDAAQNHYVTFDVVSPMIFLGRERYEKETGLFSTLESLAGDQDYRRWLMLTDEVDEAVEWVERFAAALVDEDGAG